MVNWVQEPNWVMVGTDNIKSDYGNFHVYAFTMTMGMIFAVLYSLYKFKKRDIPLAALAWGVIFIIPGGLFGASFFGKLNADGPGVNADGVGFWGLFAFWKAGMAIHGGVYVALLIGIIVFSILGRRPRISMWAYADAIVPNVLLGQVIGRWGNFFNHEVVGAPVKNGIIGQVSTWGLNDYGFVSFNKLNFTSGGDGKYSWLLKNTMAIFQGEDGTVINGNLLHHGDVVQMSPIFLIESLSLLLVWLIITFIIPNLGKWFGPKPWKKHPRDYKFSWSWTVKHFFMPWKKDLTKKTYKEVWDQSFVHHENQKAKNEFIIKYESIQKSNQKFLTKRWKGGVALNQANNPDKYWITKVGCESSAYFFGWNFVRFLLELSRPDDHLFIMYNKTLSLSLIGASALIGLIGMVLTQITIPELFRKPGWMYEKDYFEFDEWDLSWWRSFRLKIKKILKLKQN